jgi:glyoxylase-like metal-dependent hydrolase (beta-lactamase superfamily II)
MKPIEVSPDLYLVPLDQDIEGFTDFISAWVYKGEKTLLVDVGPAATVPRLVRTLNTLNIRHLDAILLTHIHIDHAGGLGDLIIQYPAPVICHGAAINHLEDPTRLWEGSLKALGQTARTYGPIKPVERNLLVDANGFSDYGITPILTPGHSPHHVSYQIGPFLFAGEAGGVFIDLSGGEFYLRPATPPRFFLETNIQSIEALLKIDHNMLCYGHFGMTRNTPQVLEAHRQQMLTWAEVIQREMMENPSDGIAERCMARLLEEDPLLSGWRKLGPAIQERERFFLRNSINGFLQYLEGEEGEKG